MLRSLGILLVAFSLLGGQATLLPVAFECPRCADHCPMKKPRLGCHSEGDSGTGSAHMPCHSGPRFASAACSHGSTAVPPSGRDFALLGQPATSHAADRGTTLLADLDGSPKAPVLEPLPDPPRFRFAV